jgi:hypothetical protein
MEFVEFATFLWASTWAWRAITRLLRGDKNSLLIVYLVFFGEYAIPLGLDLFNGLPDYLGEPGFAISSQDLYVRLLYCIFVLLVPLIWLWKLKIHSRTAYAQSSRWAIMALRIGSFLPLCFVLIAPEPKLYLEYAGVIRKNASIEILLFHVIVSMATMVAVLCVAGRCLIESFSKRTVAEIAVAVALSIWVNGKRYIVAEALIFLIIALWYRGAITGKRLVWTVFAALFALSTFSVTYQNNVRSISFDGLSKDAARENVRVDYARDSRVKMALYSSLYPERMRILDYIGQNLLYYVALPVPRTIWENKPYTYADYFTCAMLNRYPEHIGWGMTTGIFDETIANCGLIGILIGPLFVQWFCTIGDSVQGWSAHILTCVIACLVMSVQIAAFAPLIFMWLVVTARSKHIPFWRINATDTRRMEVVHENSSGH